MQSEFQIPTLPNPRPPEAGCDTHSQETGTKGHELSGTAGRFG